MTDPQRTLIAVLLDRSGSMESIKSDTEGGFAAFINQQLAQDSPDHQAWVTLAQFDTDYEVVYADLPIAQVPTLELQPRGMTALYDAVGRIITDVGAELAGQPEELRPGTVIVVVLTDGLENSSVEWTNDAVLKAIKRQETEFSWDFVFLGANMDAVAVGQSLGFGADKSITYEASPEGVDAAFVAAGNYVSRRRAAGVDGDVAGFSDEDRRAARAGKD
ncbi:MAG: vWA domain-containing protein [Mycobacterium sp.]